MNFFPNQPEDLNDSIPLEPMRLDDIGEQQQALKNLLSSLMEIYSMKLTKDQKRKYRDCHRSILLNWVCRRLWVTGLGYQT